MQQIHAREYVHSVANIESNDATSVKDLEANANKMNRKT